MSDPRPSPAGASAWAAFVVCCLIWGSTFLVISIGNDALAPLWALALRLGIAAVILTALSFALGQRFPRGAALRAAAWYGLLNMGLSMCLLYWAEVSVPSGLVAVIYATIPLSTALLARAAGLERLDRRQVAGALIALAGVGAIVAERSAGSLHLLPVMAAVAAATFASASGVALKRGPRQAPLPANAVASLVGLVVALVASVAAGEPHPAPASAAALFPVLYLAVAGSVAAFGLYAWLVNHWPVTRISFIAVVVPVVAVLLGAVVRGERLGRAEIAGSLLVMLGLAVAVVPRRARASGAVREAAGAGRS